MLSLVGDILLYASAFTMGSFVIYYHLTTYWRRKPEGRLLMTWAFLTFLFLLYTSSNVAGWLSLDTKLIIRIPVYSAFLLMGIWLFRRIRTVQSNVDSFDRIKTPSTDLKGRHD